MKNKYKVIDNFLEQSYFNELVDLYEANDFGWFVCREITNKGEKLGNLYYQTHTLFIDHKIHSPHFGKFEPLLKKLGATPVGMPIPKVAPSLSKGVITGMVVPWEIMPSFKLQELTKSHTNVAGNRGLYTTPFLFVMNKAKYDSLSPAHKKVIDNNSGMSLAKQAGVLWDGFEGPARDLAVKAGGEFHVLSGQPLAEIKKAADEVIQDWIKDANSKGLDGQKLYDTAKSLISKYEKMY